MQITPVKMIDFVTDFLRTKKEFVPMISCFDNKGTEVGVVVVAGGVPEKYEDKERTFFDIGQIVASQVNQLKSEKKIQENDVIGKVVLVTESWYVVRQKAEDFNTMKVSEEPDRSECVIFYTSTLQGDKEIVMLPFHRDANGNVDVIGKIEPMDKNFSGNLPDAFKNFWKGYVI